jgi:hypothetical protein
VTPRVTTGSGQGLENVVSRIHNKVILIESIESSGRAHPSSREINRRARALCVVLCVKNDDDDDDGTDDENA